MPNVNDTPAAPYSVLVNKYAHEGSAVARTFRDNLDLPTALNVARECVASKVHRFVQVIDAQGAIVTVTGA